jgi:hypothetical protein
MADQFMVPEKKAFVLALKDFFALPASEQARSFKALAKFDRILRQHSTIACPNLLQAFGERFCVDQFALFNQFVNSVRGDLRHAEMSLVRDKTGNHGCLVGLHWIGGPKGGFIQRIYFEPSARRHPRSPRVRRKSAGNDSSKNGLRREKGSMRVR